MRIIPVIDIIDGIAVHAVRGERKEYQPLESLLCDSDEPVAIATVFKACGFKELYVADLDAIMGKGGNLSLLNAIVEKTGLRLMVDAGISDLNQAKKIFNCKVSKLIVGTETLTSLSFVKRAITCFGSDKVIVSLDLKEGKVLSPSDSLRSVSVLEVARKLQNIGVCELIVLDLAKVGSGEGPDFSLLKQLVNNLQMNLLVGGGVRDIKDLMKLKRLGIHGVLLATALHSGAISMEEIRRLS